MTEIEARGKIKYRIANEMRKAGENKEEYEDLEIALQVMKEIREYRELGTVEELKVLRNASELWEHNNNLAYKQGRIDAIDEFAENLRPLLSTFIDRIRLDKMAEQMKGGATDEG